MKTLLVVFHTRTGGSRQMAEAVVRGAAAEAEVETRLIGAEAAGPEDLLTSEGYVFVGPENLAALSGEMKAFFDRCYYPVLDRIQGRPYAVMICAGSDGENAVRQVQRIATGWRLRPAADPLIVCTHAQTPAQIAAPKTIAAAELRRCEDLGLSLAAGLALGVF